MKQKVIIVESPSKSKTIGSYVGKDVLVLSSKGHVRDLATSGKDGLGIDVDNGFEPSYVVISQKRTFVKELIAKSKGKDVLIATDPDREGEAIGWHLAQLLNLDVNEANRIVFREITKPAILEALDHPRPIDQNLVNSQEARRMLDRIIGFKLSKLLQSKIKSKSAGRVQSVALKLIVDLEKEIEAFIPETYYEIEARFKDFKADYKIPKNKRLSKEKADQIVKESINPFVVKEVTVKESKRPAKPPFITSTLQQDASQNLSMSASRTMMVAQALYEGKEINGDIVGLITYMRTDSTRLAEPFIKDAQSYIKDTFGKAYLGSYKTTKKENTQDAHEAIRPTRVDLTPESIKDDLSKDEYKLYKRIYERAIASLMAPAIFEVTKVTFDAHGHAYLLDGIRNIFLGHLHLFDDQKTKDRLLMPIEKGQTFDAKEVISIEKVTTPPTRFNEASLIKSLESLGIGRPSTYAQIIQTIKSRDYVVVDEKRFKPTKQGVLTSEQLDLFFSEIINANYTSSMEKDLDTIAEGNMDGIKLVRDFYKSFIPMVDTANQGMKKIEPKMTDELCPMCGKPLVIRQSKYGEFTACSGFPKCRYIKKDVIETPKES
ncbi:MAG: type I DNA topoisomerase [Acholeplasmataceae bacterium]|nr:type I DNA topoisomerase [Acholeplasmataceae bacterium]